MSRPQFLQTTICLVCPKVMDQAIFRWVETLNKAISKQCPCFARKFESQISNIFDAQQHNEILRWNMSHGKRMFIANVKVHHP